MTIDRPLAQQIPALRCLWKEAFGDTDDFLDIFFHRAFSYDRCRCVTIDGKVVSALYWFDCRCQGEKLAYLYAVATARDCRGKGLCRDLMAFAEKDLRDRGFDCCVLTPGEPHLFRFYEKLGYRADFTRTRTAFSGGAGQQVVLSRLGGGQQKDILLRTAVPPQDARHLFLADAAQPHPPVAGPQPKRQ